MKQTRGPLLEGSSMVDDGVKRERSTYGSSLERQRFGPSSAIARLWQRWMTFPAQQGLCSASRPRRALHRFTFRSSPLAQLAIVTSPPAADF